MGFMRLRLPSATGRVSSRCRAPLALLQSSSSDNDGASTVNTSSRVPQDGDAEDLSSLADAIPFPELEGCALIRELHVYGQLVPTKKTDKQVQHVGFGRRLMESAEAIAARRGYRKMAVIAGIGTRNYYRKLGYEVEGDGGFMIKRISWRHPQRLMRLLPIMVLIVSLIVAVLALYAVPLLTKPPPAPPQHSAHATIPVLSWIGNGVQRISRRMKGKPGKL